MGGYCTFGYRTKEGVIKSGVVYTGYLKQMMLSFPVMGFDLIDKVLQEEPEGYGAEDHGPRAFQHEELFDCMTHYGQGTIPYLEDQVKNSDLSDEERDRMVLLCEYLRRVHA